MRRIVSEINREYLVLREYKRMWGQKSKKIEKALFFFKCQFMRTERLFRPGRLLEIFSQPGRLFEHERDECLAFDKWEWSGKVKLAELPVDQPTAVAFTALADAWLSATETEIGAALCAIGAGRTLTLLSNRLLINCFFVIKMRFGRNLSVWRLFGCAL